ncbi:MAG: mechanosensitive ion channel family protein [Saprospiraceae bacterium]
MSLKEILEYDFLNISDFHLSLYHIIIAAIILTIARFMIWLIKRILKRYFKKKEIDPGRQFAFIQFIKYIIYTIAVLMALEAVGISLSVIWGGAAALMVGIGLGLQQTFNDLVSGLILLIEGTVEVDDVVEVNGIIGTVTDIGIRTSKVETPDKISILIPNSKLVGDNAINWSHNNISSRFHIDVGVAYSSDVDLVTRLLIQAAEEHDKVLKTKKPEVQFRNFGDSSLDFKLLFFTNEYQRLEFVKSDLRYKIMKLFRANDIEIPFPQNDLWLRNGEVLKEDQ